MPRARRSPDGPDIDIPAVRAATERLVARIEELTDDDARGPSGLPAWTRGHVLTHLARNADGLVNLVEWAVTGDETPMYASREARDADIEAGALRPARQILDDLVAASQRLDAVLPRLSGDGEDAVVRLGSGATLVGRQIPYARLREIEIHAVDLDLGYVPADWPPGFSERTLDLLAPLFRKERDTPVSVLEDVPAGAAGRWARSARRCGGSRQPACVAHRPKRRCGAAVPAGRPRTSRSALDLTVDMRPKEKV